MSTPPRGSGVVMLTVDEDLRTGNLNVWNAERNMPLKMLYVSIILKNESKHCNYAFAMPRHIRVSQFIRNLSPVV